MELDRGLLWETRDGPGGRGSLPDHRGPGKTDPGGGERVSGRDQPAWQLPVGHEHGPSWASCTQAFPSLGSCPAEIHGEDNRVGAGMKESGCARLSDRDGWRLTVGGPPSVRSSAIWEGDAACRRE